MMVARKTSKKKLCSPTIFITPRQAKIINAHINPSTPSESPKISAITPFTSYIKTLVSVFQGLPSPFQSSTHPASLARLPVMTFLRRPQEHSLLRHPPIHQSHSPGVAPNLIPRHASQQKTFDDGTLSLHQE
ncbi:hypothetical protein CI102_610 [Trichoderma harzianum]|nr:hypothetical protein CI102_610 [Trichoderma harzianum]